VKNLKEKSIKENKTNSLRRIQDYKKLSSTKFIKSKKSNKSLKKNRTILDQPLTDRS